MPAPVNPAEATDDSIEAAIRSSIASTTAADDELTDDEPAEPVADPAVEPAAVVEPESEPAAVVVTDDKVVPGAVAAVAKPADKTDELDISKVPARGAGGRVNTIPQPRVVKMVEKSVERAKEDWNKTVAAPLQERVTTYETRLHSIAHTEDMMFGMKAGKPLPEAESLNAKRTFLQQLATAIPGYSELLKGAAGFGEASAPAAKEPVKAAADDPEPQPDVLDENKKPVGWSEEGLAKMRAWDRRTAARDAVAAAEDAIVKKYGLDKISGRFNEVEETRSNLRSIEQQIDEAVAKWPGFVQNADAIQKALAASADINYSLRDAYNQVLFGLATSKATDATTLEAELRDRIAEELRNAPRSTSAGPGSISTRAAEDVQTTGDEVGDAIRRSIRT